MTTPILEIYPYSTSNSPLCTETLGWLTDLQISRNGTELRTRIRLIPRRSYSMNVAFNDAIKNPMSLRNSVKELQGEQMYFPLWSFAKTVPYAGSVHGKDTNLGSSNCLRINDAMSWSLGPETSTGVRIVMPACKGLIGDISERNDIYGKLTSFTVNFDALNHNEQPAAYPGPFLNSIPVFDFQYVLLGSESTNEHKKQVRRVEDKNLFVEDYSYSETFHKTEVALVGEEEIQRFRSFLYACEGRLNPFYFKGPFNPELSLYRLSTDDVSITYIDRKLATVQLTFKELRV